MNGPRYYRTLPDALRSQGLGLTDAELAIKKAAEEEMDWAPPRGKPKYGFPVVIPPNGVPFPLARVWSDEPRDWLISGTITGGPQNTAEIISVQSGIYSVLRTQLFQVPATSPRTVQTFRLVVTGTYVELSSTRFNTRASFGLLEASDWTIMPFAPSGVRRNPVFHSLFNSQAGPQRQNLSGTNLVSWSVYQHVPAAPATQWLQFFSGSAAAPVNGTASIFEVVLQDSVETSFQYADDGIPIGIIGGMGVPIGGTTNGFWWALSSSPNTLTLAVTDLVLDVGFTAER